MWLDLEIKRQYRFDGILDPVTFFEHLSCLLGPGDTLVLGCWEAREDIRQFLSGEAFPADQMRYSLQSGFDIWRSSYPRGAAFYLRPDSHILGQLARFARSVSRAEDLCDHVAAYTPEWPLFIFHDAFGSDPLYVSSRVPRACVEVFANAINVPFSEIDFESLT